MSQNKVTLEVEVRDDRAVLPKYTHEGDACFDLRVIVDGGSYTLTSGETYIFDTGLAFGIPQGYVLLIYPRSGLGIKKGIILANSVGIIDSQYTQTSKIALHNTSKEEFVINSGDRVAQAMLLPYPTVLFKQVSHIKEYGRGDGLGSSGVK